MNKNKSLIMFFLILVIVVTGVLVVNKNKTSSEDDKPKKIEYVEAYKLGVGEYPEEFYPSYDDLGYTLYLTNFDDYSRFAAYYDQPLELSKTDFDRNDFLVVNGSYDSCRGEIVGITKAEFSKDTLNVTFGVELDCGGCAPLTYFYLIPVEKGENTKYKINDEYYGINAVTCAPDIEYKPIIYLYPEKEMEVMVKVGYPEKLTTTYPKYEDGWHVLATPNGTLIDLETNRSLYALYWEGYNTISNGIQKEGFVVHKDDIIPFLEDKLNILGLNEREANEFIIYWLPQLEQNEYNYIRFETLKEINANMPLEISPKPDTVIRVVMEYKGLDSIIEVEEQQLDTPIRKGFTVVEWGGTKLN